MGSDKWIVTLEITVTAENRQTAFEKIELLLPPDTNYLLYDAEQEKDDK